MIPFGPGQSGLARYHHRSTVIDKLKFLLARGLLTICAWLPLSLLQALAAIFGIAMNLCPTRMRETTRYNLRLCFPTLPDRELHTLVAESLRETAKTALEMGKCWRLPVDKVLALVREIEGGDILEDAYQQGKGVILLAPHLGNWEIFGYYFTEKYPSTFMYQPPKNHYFDEMIRNARSRGQARLAPTNRQGVAILLKALKRGEMVGLLPDQEPAEEGGEFADFFGVPALSMTLVSRLVERTGARVICGYARRLPRGRGFDLKVHAADPLIYDADLQNSVRGLNRTVEKCVSEAVSQYQWEYKRFKRRPDGSRFYR